MRVLKFLSITCTVFFVISCGFKNEKTVSTKSSTWVEELPDGSYAYLNGNSEIRYEENFEERSVHITGEVFFKIAEKENQPFFVYTNTAAIKVLGTEFNVRANDSKFEVEVDKGEVAVEYKDEQKKLQRGEKAFINRGRKLEKGKASFSFKKWLKKAEIDFKRIGKSIDKTANQVEDKLEDVGERLNDGKENLKDGVQDIFE